MSGRKIIGSFIDCNKDSPTLGIRVVAIYAPSRFRKFVIPCGVAHTFDNLEGIVTRDEPVWYVSDNNPDWDINNDLVSFLKDDKEIPIVTVNTNLLPQIAHIAFSQLQQDVLSQAKVYLNRYRENDDSYTTSYSESWVETISAITANPYHPRHLTMTTNNFALTGKYSYTVVPNTTSCVSDILELSFTKTNQYYWCHLRQHTILTILNREHDIITIKSCDLRNSERIIDEIKFECTPCLNIKIPAGVAYKLSGEGSYIVRAELELMVSEFEPDENLPEIGKDLVVIHESKILTQETLYPATNICPPEAIWALAKIELYNLSKMRH